MEGIEIHSIGSIQPSDNRRFLCMLESAWEWMVFCDQDTNLFSRFHGLFALFFYRAPFGGSYSRPMFEVAVEAGYCCIAYLLGD
ncbi:hypothetical protein M2277_002760 [Paenibacillus sp. LBL]|nr:hypothetical protein [Paenibacillus sp. LBL]